MKQHIAPDDLKMLGEKGKEGLSGWWKPREGDWYLDEDNCQQIVWCCEEDVTQKDLSLLSVGQMIEFLGEEYWENELFRDKGWIKADYHGELCDALWSACVEILNGGK